MRFPRTLMTRGFVAFLSLAACVSLSVNLPSDAASAREINASVQTSLDEFRQEIDGSNEVLKRARGLLVFPRVYQGGYIIGGEYGEGALLVGGKTVNYYRIASGSIGFQLGGQKKTIIIAFMTDDALRDFQNSSGWEIGADASVAVVKLGAEGTISSATLNEPVIAFVTDQKGLMYNLSLEGTKISKIKK